MGNQMFSEGEVKKIISKVSYDEKIISTKYYLSYIEKLLHPCEERFAYLTEEGYTFCEEWYELKGRLETLKEVKMEMENIINMLSEKK
jgi:hypothetical protein